MFPTSSALTVRLIQLIIIRILTKKLKISDYMQLRTNYRIFGNTIGVPLNEPRNVNLSGLPVILSLYELKVLMDKDVVIVLDKVSSNFIQDSRSSETK